MSYLNKRYGSRRALGSTIDDVLNNVVGATGSALDIASDPYLPEVVCRLAQLKQIESGGAVATCTDTADNLPGGVGLRNAVGPLRAYVYAQQNKWVYPVALAAIIGLPMWIGYELGKGRP
jgi:hypothetical protein